MRTKVKNLKTGRVLDRTFRAGERVDEADVDERTMQYVYQEGDNLVFMDTTSFEQIPFTPDQVGDARKFLKENLEVSVVFWRGRPIGVELPSFIEASVTQCDPGHEGRHRVGRHEAGHDRDRRGPPGAPLHQGGRRPPGGYAHRRVRRAGLSGSAEPPRRHPVV